MKLFLPKELIELAWSDISSFQMDVRIRTITFNVADENPPSDVPAALFGKNAEAEEPDIFILAMQEVNLGESNESKQQETFSRTSSRSSFILGYLD